MKLNSSARLTLLYFIESNPDYCAQNLAAVIHKDIAFSN